MKYPIFGIISTTVVLTVANLLSANDQRCRSRLTEVRSQVSVSAQAVVLQTICCSPQPKLVSQKLIARAGWPHTGTEDLQQTVDLQKIIDRWALATASIKTLDLQFSRISYDKIFNVEKRGNGRFRYEAPNKVRYDVEQSPIPNGLKSRREDPQTGKSYKLESCRSCSWIFMGKTPWLVDQVNGATEDVSKWASVHFIEDIIVKPSSQRFEFKLLKQTGKQIWLAIKPKLAQDVASFREMKVILDAHSFLPQATQVIDPHGHAETVHIFSNWQVNIPWQFGKNPFVLKSTEESALQLKRIGSRTIPAVKSNRRRSSVITADVSQSVNGNPEVDAGKIRQIADYRTRKMSHDQLRLQAIIALKRIGWSDIATVPHFITLLDSGEAEVRTEAAKSLGEIGPAAKTAIPALGIALNDEDQRVSNAAFESLKRIAQSAEK